MKIKNLFYKIGNELLNFVLGAIVLGAGYFTVVLAKMSYNCFITITTAQSWAAIGTFFLMILLAVAAVFMIYIIGLIVRSYIDLVKEKRGRK